MRSKFIRWQLKLFSSAGPFGYVTIDILGPLSRTFTMKHVLFMITDRCGKLTKALMAAKTTSTQVMHIFFKGWVILYKIVGIILSDTEQRFANKLFRSLCTYLAMKKLTITLFYMHRNERFKMYNHTLVSPLWAYITKNQPNWDRTV